MCWWYFFFQAEDGIRDYKVTGVQTCALPIYAAIVFAPAGPLVPAALRAVEKGGTVVCAGIHMSDIPAFPYDILWGERVVRSVANLTRRDGEKFLRLPPPRPGRPTAGRVPLARADH